MSLHKHRLQKKAGGMRVTNYQQYYIITSELQSYLRPNVGQALTVVRG